LLISTNALGFVTLWNPETGEMTARIKGHSLGIRSLAISPDGLTLVTGSVDKTIKFWDLVSHQEMLTLETPDEVMGVAYSPDGKQLAIACYDGTVKYWRAKSE
jgi:WD40 repeat protein